MSKRQLLIFGFIGIALAFGALWVGAYALHSLPEDSWAEMPTLITAVYLGVFALLGGVFSLIHGFHK